MVVFDELERDFTMMLLEEFKTSPEFSADFVRMFELPAETDDEFHTEIAYPELLNKHLLLSWNGKTGRGHFFLEIVTSGAVIPDICKFQKLSRFKAENQGIPIYFVLILPAMMLNIKYRGRNPVMRISLETIKSLLEISGDRNFDEHAALLDKFKSLSVRLQLPKVFSSLVSRLHRYIRLRYR